MLDKPARYHGLESYYTCLYLAAAEHEVDHESMVRQAAERLRQRERRRDRAREDRRARAQAWAREIAGVLAEADHSVRKIVGFGSTFETWRAFRLDSDIDLGVLGGDWSRLTAAVSPSDFDVSIVELELQNQEFTDYVLEHCVVLYEKS